MGKKRQQDERGESLSPLAQRIKHLCEELWEGNMSQMGRELGISHPVMSRVLAGTQPPPGKLLEALAKREGMNLRWLFAGEGDFRGEQGISAGGGHFCPIASSLLPGKPADHPELLTFATLPVASALYSETAYCYRVGADDPIVKARSARVAANDYLLIETSENWTRRAEAFGGRLVVIREYALRKSREVVLGVMERDEDYFADGSPYEVTLLGKDEKVVLYSAWTREAAAQRLKGAGGEIKESALFLDDLVGVCIQLVRILDRVEWRPGRQ
jgi:transcriptional regulator with XRE-family HTH domain